ncbi:Inducer of phenazine A [Micromonospora arborensis]|uniref:Inducer of phenazine A n=1 Tax=Micromonospora arborensis TaxID=2116518 RepID=UPI0033EC51DB
MTSQLAELTPHMVHYNERLYEDGTFRWLPYLMYFHPADYRSEVVNTDAIGFRITHGKDEQASPGSRLPREPVKLLVGSSSVFGVGATNDAATLPSRLWSHHAPRRPWLNFGGRSHNSTQELLLFMLYRHLLPPVEEIVIYSGFNNLGLAKLPDLVQGDHGAFYLCNDYFAKVSELRKSQRTAGGRFRRQQATNTDAEAPVKNVDQQIAHAADLTLRHLDTWRVFASALGARLSFVLQPLAPWVRERPAAEEEALFRELDERFSFTAMHGDVTQPEVGRRYATALRDGCSRQQVNFLDMNTVLAAAAGPDDWIFVDRCHCTDAGYDLVARLLTEHLALS